ncbi:hypothetical protein [Kribbella sp. NPDC049584]|uniref:hypothetical protein n=1 Tax=Kribbella sp. NPDC049584 TaxID=3154833 RepID=UPI00341F337D
MSQHFVYDITSDVDGPAYRELLELSAELSGVFALMLRSGPSDLFESGQMVLDGLEPYVESRDSVGACPGSQLYGDQTYERYLYSVGPESVRVLAESALSLFDWVNPRLPEDLHFLRTDGSIVLGTVAQENDGWLELTDTECLALEPRLPREIQLRKRG